MKRYALIVYKAKYGWDNYTDYIYQSGEYDTKEHTVIIRETNSFKTLMKMWGNNLKHYQGYTYCVRDRGPKVTLHDPMENVVVGGIYDSDDEEALLDHYRFGRNYEVTSLADSEESV